MHPVQNRRPRPLRAILKLLINSDQYCKTTPNFPMLNAGPHGGQKHLEHLEQLKPNPLKSTLPSTCST